MAAKDFKEYIWLLFPSPWKKLQKEQNSWRVLAEAIGQLFDDSKADLMWVREQAAIQTCDVLLLDLFGQERDMPRLQGESADAYRARLQMKAEIARTAGTNDGIKTAVKALGFDNSYVEPYRSIDPDRWAEFLVWLQSSKRAAISTNDFAVIDEEISKIKPASALPNYGLEFSADLVLQSKVTIGSFMMPMCGAFRCGTYPPRSELI